MVRRGGSGVNGAGERIACTGMRVRRGCGYHGLALNVDIGLEPFGRIKPCGYEGLQVTSMAKQLSGVGLKLELIGQRLMDIAASMLRVSDTDAYIPITCPALGYNRAPLVFAPVLWR